MKKKLLPAVATTFATLEMFVTCVTPLLELCDLILCTVLFAWSFYKTGLRKEESIWAKLIFYWSGVGFLVSFGYVLSYIRLVFFMTKQ